MRLGQAYMQRAPDRIINRTAAIATGRECAIFARERVYDLTIVRARKPGWRNGIRRGLKILWSESSVRVRPPPPARVWSTFKVTRQAAIFPFFYGSRVPDGFC